jgi:ribosomal protein S27AE
VINQADNTPLAAAITCPACGMTSHHPTDIAEGYCGRCHDWTTARRYQAAAECDFAVLMPWRPTSDHG